MRLLTFFMLLTCIQVNAAAMAQRVTLDVRNGRLVDVFDEIRKQSDVDFVYRDAQIKQANRVTINVRQMPITDALAVIFKNQPLTYKIENNTIVVQERHFVEEDVAPAESSLLKQQAVSGMVSDSVGTPIAGVSVTIKGQQRGTITGQDGHFTIEAQSTDVLVFSMVGYRSQEVSAGAGTIRVVLSMLPSNLEEVVVVGYGVQRKRDLTGAVSQIKGEDLKNMPVRNATEALQGQVAGVLITATGGSPGTPPAVRIRGIGTVNDNNPLYVVDGLPQSDIGWLNPNDITSMEVLKDDSATAIYGARAANGVIMVTTAKGSMSGNELHSLVTYDTHLGFQNPVKTYDMMNAEEFMNYKNLANVNAGLDPFFSEEEKSEVLDFLRTNFGSEEGTNWWKEINNRNAVVQNHGVSISGGMKDLAYRTSLQYMDQQGIIKGSDYDRLSWRSNFNHNIREWLRLSGNFGLINETRGNVLEGSPGFNTAFIAFVADPISPVYRTNLTNIPGFLKDAFFLDRIDQNNPWSFYSPILL